MPSTGEKYYFISSLGRGLGVLELIAEQGELGVTALASQLQTSKADCHRYLMTLKDLGYLEKTENGRYRLSFKVVELGMKKLSSFQIRHIANPLMQELSISFGETVNLGHWDGRGIVHLDKIDSREILRMDLGLGAVAPAYCSGLGKAILAFLPNEELDTYLKNEKFYPLTSKTIVSIDEIQFELKRIRKNGFAVDNEELSIGLRCVAAPVFDHTGRPSFALSISGPTHRITEEQINIIAKKVKDVSERLTAKIGGSPIKMSVAN